jgi:hypothetical protein
MKKLNDKAVETIFVVAATLGVLIIVSQILTATIIGVIRLFQ